MNDYDLAIIGGGLAGASLALALKDSGLRIAVIEALAPRLDQPAQFDARVLALSEATRRIYATLGLWDALSPHATAIRHIHVSDRGHAGMTRLHAEEHGVAALGQVMEMRDLGRTVWAAMQALPTVRLHCPARVAGLELGAEAVRLTLDSGECLGAKLVVVADGGDSALRRQLGIDAIRSDYGQTAVIANVVSARPHQGWAYERFTDSGPLALLPMSQGRMSLVYCLRPDQVEAVRALDEPAFLARLQERFGWRVGRFLKVGERHAYPLAQSAAVEQVRPRLVVLGNAAHTLHPIAGQGFNLSLRDVAALAEIVADTARAAGDIGEFGRLLAYAEARRADQARALGATDGLARLFANDFGPLVCARNAALKALDLVPGLKAPLAEAAMGLNGPAPRLVRGLPLA